jgi:hypothetical protein
MVCEEAGAEEVELGEPKVPAPAGTRPRWFQVSRSPLVPRSVAARSAREPRSYGRSLGTGRTGLHTDR